MNTLQKVTLALVTEEATRHFVTDAARLGFPADVLPESLETDLGTEAPLLLWSLDAEGTAVYRQKAKAQKAVSLRVRNVNPGLVQIKRIDALIVRLEALIETSRHARAELAAKISCGDDAALSALVQMPTYSALEAIHKAKQARTVLSMLREVPARERADELRRYVKQADAWLDVWRPNLAHPLRTVIDAGEHEAVRELRQMVRAYIEPNKTQEAGQ